MPQSEIQWTLKQIYSEKQASFICGLLYDRLLELEKEHGGRALDKLKEGLLPSSGN